MRVIEMERPDWSPLFSSRDALFRALERVGCVRPTARELALLALAARIRRAFEVCR